MRLALFSAVLFAAAPAIAAQRDVYVSPTGNDGNSCTYTQPCATPDRARAYVQAQGWNQNGDDVRVNFFPGDWWLTSPLTLGPADSGTAGHPVTYQPLNGLGQSRIMGGQIITGWTLFSGNIYRVPFSGTIYTLFENGKRSTRARAPNYVYTPLFASARAPYNLSANSGLCYYPQLWVTNGDIPSIANLPDVRLKMWSGGQFRSWFMDDRSVTLIAPNQYQLDDNAKLPVWCTDTGLGSRYFAEGDLNFLDASGEWVLSGGYLYYWARDGAIANQEIVAPTIQKIFDLEGTDTSHRVSYVTIKGFTVQYTDFNSVYRFGESALTYTGPFGYGWWRTAPADRQAGIYLNNTDHIIVSDNHVLDTGLAGIEMFGGYGQTNSISRNWVEKTGIDGIILNGPEPGAGDTMDGNTVSDDLINNVGELGGGKGLAVNQSGKASPNIITNLEIFNTPRNCIQVTGAGVTSDGGTKAVNYTAGNQISYIRCYAAVQDSNDAGAIGANFYENDAVPYDFQHWWQITIDAAIGHPSVSTATTTPACWFMDNESSGQKVESVQCANSQDPLGERNNASGGHVLLNVFAPWGAGVTEQWMHYQLIGLTSAFPYRGAPAMFEDFEESVTTRWSVIYGDVRTSTSPVYAGSRSMVPLADQFAWAMKFPYRRSVAVEGHFYDPGSGAAHVVFSADNGAVNDGSVTPLVGIGISTSVDATHYVVVNGASEAASTKARSAGWHTWVLDPSGGTGTDIYVDGTLIGTVNGAVAYSRLVIGDLWADGVTASVGYDNLQVLTTSDSFENGLGQWTTALGTPVTSTAQAHDGTHSFVQNQDGEAIYLVADARQYRIASGWFRDDASDTTLEARMCADESDTSNNTWNTTQHVCLGVLTSTSTTNYVWWNGSTVTVTNVTRTTGWHHFVLDYTSGAGVTMSIDENLAVPLVSGLRQFNVITLGDLTASDGLTGTVYWDQISARRSL